MLTRQKESVLLPYHNTTTLQYHNTIFMQKFNQIFGESKTPIRTFFAPGRVNIIGDHIDYNGGMVLPAAIHLGITAQVRERDDDIIRMRSTMGKKRIEIDLKKAILFSEAAGWGNYPLGVIHLLQIAEIPIKGADILFDSTLPVGSGLSSSAAIEVLTGYVLMTLAGFEVDRVAMALLCQKAENEFVGMNCGIMDQFAVAMGKAQHAIQLNCQTLEYQHIPFNIEGFKLVVMNSNKERELAGSAYNERRAACEKALALIREKHDIPNLCEAEFPMIIECVKDPILLARARHVWWENQYVHEAIEALEDGDWKTLGESMDASHLSLANDYEVSCDELDFLVDAARSVTGCVGARMTGAGFGGCAVALVQEDAISDFTEYVKAQYHKSTNLDADIYVCEIVNGVEER